jgi:UPF0716 protein FxsA
MVLLLALFIFLPIAEIYVIIKVGEAIGVLPTIALLFLDGFIGAALARSQGAAAWARFNRALAEGRVPAREVLDGAMVIVGGAFLLAPGFITDVIGLLLLLPPTRALLRTPIVRLARRGTVFRVASYGGQRARGPYREPGPPRGTGYDYEGSAREVTDPDEQLGPGGPDG